MIDWVRPGWGPSPMSYRLRGEAPLPSRRLSPPLPRVVLCRLDSEDLHSLPMLCRPGGEALPPSLMPHEQWGPVPFSLCWAARRTEFHGGRLGRQHRHLPRHPPPPRNLETLCPLIQSISYWVSFFSCCLQLFLALLTFPVSCVFLLMWPSSMVLCISPWLILWPTLNPLQRSK